MDFSFLFNKRGWSLACLSGGVCLLLAACQTAPAEGNPEDEKPTDGKPTEIAPAEAKPADAVPTVASATDVNFLLSMTFEEAKALSPQSIVVAPYYKIAADEISVLKQDAKGQPLRVRARGHVFLQIDFNEQLLALGQEAYIESGGEIIIRGKPLLKRGRSVVEGLSDFTVYYIRGLRLQVIGSHRMVKQEGYVPPPPTAPGAPARAVELRSYARMERRSYVAAFLERRPESDSAALSPEDVPAEMRASPLLPAPEGSDIPKELPADPAAAPLPPVPETPPQ